MAAAVSAGMLKVVQHACSMHDVCFRPLRCAASAAGAAKMLMAQSCLCTAQLNSNLLLVIHNSDVEASAFCEMAVPQRPGSMIAGPRVQHTHEPDH